MKYVLLMLLIKTIVYINGFDLTARVLTSYICTYAASEQLIC